jgi:hypothetical protein
MVGKALMSLNIMDGPQNFKPNLIFIFIFYGSTFSSIAEHNLLCMQFAVIAYKVITRLSDYSATATKVI